MYLEQISFPIDFLLKHIIADQLQVRFEFLDYFLTNRKKVKIRMVKSRLVKSRWKEICSDAWCKRSISVNLHPKSNSFPPEQYPEDWVIDGRWLTKTEWCISVSGSVRLAPTTWKSREPSESRYVYASRPSGAAWTTSQNNPLFPTVSMTHLQPINCFVPAAQANSKCVSRNAAILLSNFIKKPD